MALDDPLDLGTRQVRNRLVFGPHVTNLGRRRSISERHVAYYARRAAGGAGLIVTEEASVHALDWPYERAPLAADCGPGWAAVAKVCHDEGTLVVAALGHNGMQGSSAYSQRETWAPSRVADAVTRELPKEMEPADIAAVLAGFREAARLARAAGLDGVEINAGQHSLIRQFLSGLTNQRGDEWGAVEEGPGRARFAKQVLTDARAALGDDGIVGLRLSCDELAPWAGITPDAALDIAAELAPLVDYLVVVRGSIYSTDATTPDCHTPAGFNLDLARAIAERVRGVTVVMAQGSVVDPTQAAEALADGSIGLIEMTRAQIADPDLANKVVAGRGATLRPCVLCNQRCRVRDSRNPIVTCTVNPSAGYEFAAAGSDTAETHAPVLRARVRIVGAGPTGLEAARLLAEWGVAVTVYDRREIAGGIVSQWARAAGREQLGVIVPWLIARCEEAGVAFELGASVGASDIDAWGGDIVVLCTGGTDRPVEYAVSPGTVILPALEALDAHFDGGLAAGDVAIWDPIGGPIGISLAETFAPSRAVTLITPDFIPGTLLSLTGDLAAAATRLHRLGVTVAKRRRLRAVAGTTLTLQDVHTGERSEIDAATTIDAGHRVADATLWQSTGQRLLRAGDAVAPRTIFEAILEGRRLAHQIAAAENRATPSVGVR